MAGSASSCAGLIGWKGGRAGRPGEGRLRHLPGGLGGLRGNAGPLSKLHRRALAKLFLSRRRLDGESRCLSPRAAAVPVLRPPRGTGRPGHRPITAAGDSTRCSAKFELGPADPLEQSPVGRRMTPSGSRGTPACLSITRSTFASFSLAQERGLARSSHALFFTSADVVLRLAVFVAVATAVPPLPVAFGPSKRARLACRTDRMSTPMSGFGFAACAGQRLLIQLRLDHLVERLLYWSVFRWLPIGGHRVDELLAISSSFGATSRSPALFSDRAPGLHARSASAPGSETIHPISPPQGIPGCRSRPWRSRFCQSDSARWKTA